MDAEPKLRAVALEYFSQGQMPGQNFEKSGHGLQKFRKRGNIHKDLPAIVEDRSALCQGFSIREYVGKVRGVDIRKCWPLAESLLEDRLREGRNPPLPPLESPNYKWWACRHCLKNIEEPKHCEILSDRQHIVNPERQNNNYNIKRMIAKELTVETFSEADPGIIQELEEQISKLRTFQICAQEEKIVKGEDSKRRMESTEERSDNIVHNSFQPTVKVTAGKTGTSKCTSKVHKRGKSDTSKQKAQEDQNQSKELDSTLNKASANQNQVQNLTFTLMQTDCELLNGADIREDTEKAQRVRTKAQDELQPKTVSTESKRNKTDNLNFEANKCDSVKHGISDINNAESSGLKICPVCKNFTSNTITAVNAHMDGCLAQTSKADRKQGKKQKQQSRVRKKRSIVEICAVSPVVEISVNHLENSEMDKSESLQGMDVCSDEATASLKSKKNITTTEGGAESVVANGISGLRCKRKKATKVKASSVMKSAKAKKRKTETLQTKIGWQQASKDNEEPKPSSAPSHSIETDDGGAQHQPKRSKITVEAADSNVEHQSCMQENLELNSGLVENNERDQSGILVEHFPYANVLPTENKEQDNISNDTPGIEETERVIENEPTGEPSSVLTVANANPLFNVCHPERTEDPVIPQNQSSESDSEKSDLLRNNEPTRDKADNTDSSRLQVDEQTESQYPHSPKLSKQNPAKIAKNQQQKSMYSESECSFIHSVEGTPPPMHDEISDQGLEPVKFKYEFPGATATKQQQSYAQHNVNHGSCDKNIDWDNDKSKGLHCLQMEGPTSDTRKAGEGHIKNAGFNLNQKVCVLPRDARGRFISSARMNGEKESDVPGPQSKETQNHKSSIKRDTATIHNEASFATNAALFNARTAKSSSMQTFDPTYQDYHSGKKSAAQEVLFPYPERLTAVREALLPTAALSHLEAPSSLNAMNHVKFCMPRQCCNYGYIGLPLDSQGELVKHFPNMGAGVNQQRKIPNYVTANEHLVTESTKMLQEFNFVERMKTSYDVHSVKRPDHWQEYSVSTTNQSRDDRTGIKQSSPLDQIQMDRAHFGSSHIRIVGSSSGTPNTSSDPRLCMQTSAGYGYHWDQKQKASALEKSYPEVHNTRKENSTTQPVMRLMGQSFTIEGENKVVKADKDSRQGNVKNTQSIPRGTGGVSSSIQKTAYVDLCNTCNEDQFYQAASGINTSCQDREGKANASKDLTESNPSEWVAIHNCAMKDESNTAQAWVSSSPFRVPMAISPVCPMSTNTCVNERPKMTHKSSYIRDPGCLQQKQTYSQLLKSCLGQNRFQKPECNSWMYTSNPCSRPIQSELVQLLPCATSSLRSIPDPSHTVTCATVHSSSFPAETLCQPTTSMFIANCTNLTMHGKRTFSSTNESERENVVLELPKNVNRKRFKNSHAKGRLIDTVDPESKCKDDSRTRKSAEGEEGLHRKWTLEMSENYGRGTLQKYDPFSESEQQEKHKGKITFHQEISSSSLAVELKSREMSKYNIPHFKSGEIHKSIESRVEFGIAEGIDHKRKMDNDCILNAQSHTGIPPKCQAKESEAFTGPNGRFLESEMRPSTIGLHCLNAVSPFRLAEPIKLSGGAKHILKPSQNKGQKQSLPVHYTLPFSVAIAEEKDRDL